LTEKLPQAEKIEQKYIETEQTFLPLFPEKITAAFSYQADKIIDQVYLSHPSEEYNLRIRRINIDKKFTPTLKNKGVQTKDGLQRKEINGTMTSDSFWAYAKDVPRVHKVRATPHENIDIDFFDDGHIHVESENPESWQRFIREHEMENDFIEVTGDRIVDNEWRAHREYRANNKGREALVPKPDLNADEVNANILRTHREKGQVTVAVGGRSGSGKSTLVRQLRQQLHEIGLTTGVISTDDYNYGNTHLYRIGGGHWENYDSNETYDLALCRAHLGRLASGLIIPRHVYDFASNEPLVQGRVQPSDVLFVEGIKAHHSDFRQLADLYIEVPTSLATSIGRRVIQRDIIERPLFSPEQNLTNYLKYTEPEYQALF